MNQTRNVGAWLCLWLMLGFLVAPTAHADTDQGEFQILQARYGTASQHVDVTQKLRELARQDRSFRLGNDTFGLDPHYNHVKTLRIYTRTRDGQTRTFEYREGQVVDGALFTGWGGGNWGSGDWGGGWGDANAGGNSGGGNGSGADRHDDGEWQILQARYGTASRNIDVTQRLKELAAADRVVRLTNTLFGVDPHPNQFKSLRILARNKSGQTRSFEVAENASIDGRQFTGWSGGDWGHGGWNGGWGDGNFGGGNSGNDARGLTIISAVYGAGRQTIDVTQRLRERMQGGRLALRADNALAGSDPAPETRKSLRVTYSVDGGRTQQIEVAENDSLRLP